MSNEKSPKNNVIHLKLKKVKQNHTAVIAEKNSKLNLKLALALAEEANESLIELDKIEKLQAEAIKINLKFSTSIFDENTFRLLYRISKKLQETGLLHEASLIRSYLPSLKTSSSNIIPISIAVSNDLGLDSFRTEDIEDLAASFEVIIGSLNSRIDKIQQDRKKIAEQISQSHRP